VTVGNDFISLLGVNGVIVTGIAAFGIFGAGFDVAKGAIFLKKNA